MAGPSPLHGLWARVIDEFRCTELEGVGGRWQLIVGHTAKTCCSGTRPP